MPTDPDENPFARNSVWPKMPQTPFRVASLPRPVERPQAPQPAAPERPQQTITPVFVRSTDAATPVFARPAAAPPPVRPSPPVVQPLEAPPPVVIAVETPFVAPTPRAAAPRKAPVWPGLIAVVVGLAGIVGLVVLLTRDEPAQRPVATPVIAIAPPAVVPPAASPLAEPPRAEPAAPAILARSTPIPVRRLLVAPPSSRAADAAQAALEAPALVLAPALPAPAVETPPFKPDAAPDPNAPITTRRP